MALFVVLFGVLAGLTVIGASEGNATQAFLASLVAQDNEVATAAASLLMLGVLALAVATIGSLFAAALDVVAQRHRAGVHLSRLPTRPTQSEPAGTNAPRC